MANEQVTPKVEECMQRAAELIRDHLTWNDSEKPTYSEIRAIIASAYQEAQPYSLDYRRGWEAGINAAAEYMMRCSERWVESLPIDEVASLHCKQAAKGIRALVPQTEKR
jgi:hypothetical protein